MESLIIASWQLYPLPAVRDSGHECLQVYFAISPPLTLPLHYHKYLPPSYLWPSPSLVNGSSRGEYSPSLRRDEWEINLTAFPSSQNFYLVSSIRKNEENDDFFFKVTNPFEILFFSEKKKKNLLKYIYLHALKKEYYILSSFNEINYSTFPSLRSLMSFARTL